MMDATDWTIVIGCLALAVFFLAMAYRSQNRKSAALDKLGARYGVKRWEDETNEQYAYRIDTRISITGGRQWRS